ncbi:hypothetical protein SLA2020_370530 [Shorea laevis]
MGFSMQPYGIQAMLKEGYKHLSGLEEAVLKNIDACKELSAITRTSLGPNGMNKMVINHLDKLFVTNDAATIVNELKDWPAPSEIITGYTKAINKTVGILGELEEKGPESMDVRVKKQVITRMKAAVGSEQFGQEDVLCSLIADLIACIQVCPKNPASFDADNVRVAKLLGGGLHNSTNAQ